MFFLFKMLCLFEDIGNKKAAVIVGSPTNNDDSSNIKPKRHDFVHQQKLSSKGRFEQEDIDFRYVDWWSTVYLIYEEQV